MERNLRQRTAWRGCPWWGGMLAVRGNGTVLLGGLGGTGGALRIRKAKQSFSSCYRAGIRWWLCLKLPFSHWAVGREGEWPGCGMCCAPAAPDRPWGMRSSAPTGFGVFAERDGGTSGLAWKRHKHNIVLHSVSVSGS